MNPVFHQLNKPYMYGKVAYRDDGIDVEVVQCYADQWSIFLTRDDQVVACSIAEYRKCGDGYLTFQDAMAIAKTLID